MGWLSNLFGGGESGESETTERPPAGDPDEAPDSTPDVDASTYDAAVLFSKFPEFDAAKLREVADAAEMAPEEVDATDHRTFVIRSPGAGLRIHLVAEPFPAELSDRELLPAEFPRDRAHVGISSEADISLEHRNEQPDPHSFPDPWGPHGAARQTTRLVRQLLEEGGMAVALNRAGGLLVPAQQFLSLSDGLDDPGYRPFEAWLHLSRETEGAPLETDGLRMFGLPEISAQFDHEDDYWRARRELEAVKFAAARMIHENRVLDATPEGDGRFGFEPLDGFPVPLGVEAGAELPEIDDDADAVPYEVRLDGDRLELRSETDATIWESWASLEEGADEESTTVGLPAYQALFRKTLSETLDQAPDVSIEVDEFPDMEPFDCDVYRSGASPTTLMVTNGLGRQRFGTGPEGATDRRVELAVRTARDGGPILDVIANVAAGVALGDDTFASGDTIHFEEPLYGLQYFLLDDFVDVQPPEGGPTILVWLLVPLSEDDYRTIEADGAESWLDGRDLASSPEFAERWVRTMQ